MDKLLYKGFETIDNIRNRETGGKKPRRKEDYLFKKLDNVPDRDLRQERQDDIYNYKISIPKRAEYSSVKILNDPDSLFKYLTMNDAAFLESDNFEKKFMKEVPKFLWETEKMEDLGDYVLLFPNPDKRGTEKLDDDRTIENGIQLKTVEEWFFEIFEGNSYQFPFKKKFMTALKEAFTRAFVNLDIYEPPTSSEKNKILREKEQRQAEEAEQKKQQKEAANAKELQAKKDMAGGADPNHPGLELTQVKKTTKKKKRQDQSSAKIIETENNETAPLKSEAVALQHEEPGDQPANQEQNLEARDKIPLEAPQLPGPKTGEFRNPGPNQPNPAGQRPENNPPKDPHNPSNGPDPAKQGKKLTPEEEKAAQEASYEKEKIKFRRVWGGKHYTKDIEKVEDKSLVANVKSSQYYWYRTNYELDTKDFLTLLRKTTCAVLANQGFIIREIFVNNGKQIALVLSLPEANMHNLAQQMKLNKTVEFGVADLMSLEPIDKKNRPLRTNTYLLDEQLWEKQYTATLTSTDKIEEVNSIRKEINTLLLTDCNFKKIVRMCEGTWTENEDDYSNTVFDHELIDLEVWKDYLTYLRCIAIHVRNIMQLRTKVSIIEDFYYGKTKMAACGNMDRRDLDACELSRLVNRLVVKAFLDTISLFPSLSNMWMKVKTKPSNYAYEYTLATSHMRPRNRKFFQIVWMDYFYHYPYKREEMEKLKAAESKLESREKRNEEEGQEPAPESVNPEDQEITLYNFKFSKVERLKIINYLIGNIIDVEALDKCFRSLEDIITSKFEKIIGSFDFLNGGKSIYFPLHNRNMTEDYNYREKFEQIRKVKKVYNTLTSNKIRIMVQFEETTADSGGVVKNLEHIRSKSVLNEVYKSRHNRSINDQSFKDLEKNSKMNSLHKPSYSNRSSSAQYRQHSEYQNQQGQGHSSKNNIIKTPAALKFKLATIDKQFGYYNNYLSNLSDEYQINRRMKIDYDKKNSTGPSQGQQPLEAPVDLLQELSIPKDTATPKTPLEKMKLVVALYRNDRKLVHPELSEPSQGEPQPQNNNILPDRNVDSQNPALKAVKPLPVKNKPSVDDKNFVATLYNTPTNLDLRLMAHINDGYEISNKKLIDAVLQALTTNISIRESITATFAKLTVFDVRNFVENSINFPIKDHFTNTWFNNLKKYPEATVRSYFGEKIALYFAFLNFYRDRTVWISMLGIIGAALQVFYYIMYELWFNDPQNKSNLKTVERAYEWTTIFIGVVIVIWGRRLQIGWRNYEQEFSLRYGMSNIDEKKEVRSSFKGKYMRSIENDTNNSFEENKGLRNRVRFLQYLFVLAFCALTSYTAFEILEWKREAFNNKWIVGTAEADGKDESFFDINETVFNVIEFVRIIIFQEFFYWIIKKFIKGQNIKYQEDMEDELIINAGMYQLFNNGIIIVITAIESLIVKVAIVPDPEDPSKTIEQVEHFCIREDCAEEISMFFFAYCIMSVLWILFAKVFFNAIVTKIIKKIKAMIEDKLIHGQNENVDDMDQFIANHDEEFKRQESLKESVNGQPARTYRSEAQPSIASERAEDKAITKPIMEMIGKYALNIEEKQKLKENEMVNRVVNLFYGNPAALYTKLNLEIDDQIKNLEDYGDEDFGSSVDNYLSLFNAYSVTVMFGISLPISFLVCWFISVLESYLDRYDLISAKRREIPKSTKTIGLWLKLMQVVGVFSIWSNSFFIAFILYIDKSTVVKMSSFLGISIGLTLLLFVYEEFTAKLSEGVVIITTRAEYIKSFLFTKPSVDEVSKEHLEVVRNFNVFKGVSHKKKPIDYLGVAQSMNEEYEEKLAKQKELDEFAELAKAARVKSLAGLSGDRDAPLDVSGVHLQQNKSNFVDPQALKPEHSLHHNSDSPKDKNIIPEEPEVQAT